MAGEIIGLDGIVNDHHTCDAVALEDAEVCVMPFDRIGDLSREVNALQHHVHRIMSREIVREHGVMLLLGSMRAEERLAAFLLNLVQRLHARGFSRSELVLRMTREEIGSYLGLKLETVSRTFSKFVEDGIIEVRQRHVHKIMSREIVREHGVMLLLGSMRAEERLAAFLLNLVQRLHARGFSQSELVLRMTREEIGSYLGLKLETVSRTFSKFVEEGIVEVKQRHVRIVNADALKQLVNPQVCN
jgi:CRP-like cAMP-binding protein